LCFGGAVLATALAGGSVSQPGGWYQGLRKPAFTPPSWVFGPAWTVLYVLIAWSGYRVWRRPASPARRRALGWWGAQLVLNGAWSPIFFGLQRPGWALVDLGLLVPAVAAYTAAARRVDRPAAWMMAPYLGWIGFATALNAGIVVLNRPD
jgi:tryptophan-rich sensory protein